MADPDVYLVVEEVLGFIEPDAAITKDPAMARPATYAPSTLYCYPERESLARYESGSGVRQDFRLVLDVMVDDQGEGAGGSRLPAVTAELRARVKAYAGRVKVRQHGSNYDLLTLAGVEWLALGAIDARGARAFLEGYKIWP